MNESLTDTKQFSALFEQYKEPFILFANSYIRNREASEDIFVEAMMQYWTKRNELPAGTNIPAYILTSVKNLCLNHLRHIDIRIQVEEQLLSHSARELNFRISTLESCDPMNLFASEIHEIVSNALSELPKQTRVIFYKSRYQNKTNREIAEELGVDIKTVEYHISKTLKILRIRLKDYLPLLALLFNRDL